jgi:hypothetical protein
LHTSELAAFITDKILVTARKDDRFDMKAVTHRWDTAGDLTTAAGAPVADNQNSMSAGPRGPLLLQDLWLIEKLAHFDREVIPERRMHAKGSGALGAFRVTHDISRYTPRGGRYCLTRPFAIMLSAAATKASCGTRGCQPRMWRALSLAGFLA